MLRVSRLVLSFSILVTGCLDAPDYASTTTAERDALAASVPAGERPRGIYVDIPEEYRVDPLIDPDRAEPPHVLAAAAPRIIYMNRTGGTYTPGFDDARTNRSSIAGTTATISPWSVSEAGWQEVMSCVRAQYARFNVEITDVDPGNVPHFESVVAGRPGDLNNAQIEGAAGVSPWEPQNCSVIENSIVYTFAELFGDDYQAVCEVVAQEVAHSFGLDHEYLCSDPMTYLSGCGAKSFQDVDAPCGEFQAQGPRQCTCSATQNSVELLTARLGVRDDQRPQLGIAFPQDGEIVAPGFQVRVDASDDNGVTEVELLIDGASVGTDSAAPFEFTAPSTLADGDHTVEVVARDASGETTTTITVTVDAASDNDGGGDDGDGDGGGDGDGDGGGSSAEGALTGGCSTGGPTGLGGLVLAGLALGRARRRRR